MIEELVRGLVLSKVNSFVCLKQHVPETVVRIVVRELQKGYLSKPSVVL